LENEVKSLKKQLETTENKLENAPEDVKAQLGEFVIKSKEETSILEKDINEIRTLTNECAEYFCEDPAKFKLDEYLNVFKQFCENIKKARDENEQFKKQEKRRVDREKKAEEERLRKEKLGIKDEPRKKGGRIPPPKEVCIIDNLMDEIKNGFPLKKRGLSEQDKPNSPVKKTPQRSKLNWKKTKALASFIVSGVKEKEDPTKMNGHLTNFPELNGQIISEKDNNEINSIKNEEVNKEVKLSEEPVKSVNEAQIKNKVLNSIIPETETKTIYDSNKSETNNSEKQTNTKEEVPNKENESIINNLDSTTQVKTDEQRDTVVNNAITPIENNTHINGVTENESESDKKSSN